MADTNVAAAIREVAARAIRDRRTSTLDGEPDQQDYATADRLLVAVFDKLTQDAANRLMEGLSAEVAESDAEFVAAAAISAYLGALRRDLMSQATEESR